MRAYIGQTRGRKLIAELARLGYGEMTVRDEVPPRRTPWALDNGAFRDWKAGTPFDADAFRRSLDALERCAEPDFVVCPDRIAAGNQSLLVSRSWLPELRARGCRVALVAQDGMDLEVLERELTSYDVLFVGGTKHWKHATGSQLVALGHRAGKAVHIGRISSMKHVRWARSIGADSIDSCVPLWSTDNLDRFRRALLEEHIQVEMF